MHTATIDEYPFLQKLDSCMSEKTRNLMGEVESEARRSYNIPENDLKHIIALQTIELERLAAQERIFRQKK
jgi:hypothetical protein